MGVKCLCSDWTENFPILNAPFIIPRPTVKYDGLPFIFCPWCSEKLINSETIEHLTTKSTVINNKYHVRLLDGEKVIDEMVCEEKIDIGYCCSYMLRWYSKMGGVSQMAEASRDRIKEDKYASYGKVWTKTQWEQRHKSKGNK